MAMVDLLNFFKKKDGEKSKDVAKERLKLVLVHDRANVSPQFLEQIKGEIMQVISKYMDLDDQELDFQLTQVKSDDGVRFVPALVANIPIKNMKEQPDKK